MAERKGAEKGGGGEKRRGRMREECGLNGRSARLTPY